MSSTDIPVPQVVPMPRLAVGVVLAIVVSIAVNTGIAFGARSLDPHGTQIGLALIAYGPLTALGVLAGSAGWAGVRRFATRPRAVLRVLVPVVVVLSFVPGVVLLAAGNSPLNVVGLWVMHLVVTAVTVTLAARVLPLRS